jgi:septum formation protein
MLMPSDTPNLILASASPRRRYLLRQAGLAFDVVPSGVDETRINAAIADDVARRTALAKAGAVAQRFPRSWVIGADTIVVIDGLILGKPQSPAQARSMLERLSGRDHDVVTGWCLCRRDPQRLVAANTTTRVTFKRLDPSQIQWYMGTGEPFDKAGAYGIQGHGAFLVRRISGSYTNVVGLPVCEVIETLEAEGILGQCRNGDSREFFP